MKPLQWLEKITGTYGDELSTHNVAMRSGIPQATLWRRVKAGNISADHAILIARAYNIDVREALLDLEIITENEWRRAQSRATLADATDQDIVEEIGRRLALEENTSAFDKPLDEVTAKEVREYDKETQRKLSLVEGKMDQAAAKKPEL